MSVFKVHFLQCDAKPYCGVTFEDQTSAAELRRRARDAGWQVGRGHQPDLCPDCKAPPPSEGSDLG